MSKKTFVRALPVLLLVTSAACSYPQLRPSAGSQPQEGGGSTEAAQAIAAQLTQPAGQKSQTPMASYEVGFHCVPTLAHETVPNPKLCRGIVFHVRDSDGNELTRLLPNEEGVFRFRGASGANYSLAVGNAKQWELVETGPFYAGRDYTVHLKGR